MGETGLAEQNPAAGRENQAHWRLLLFITPRLARHRLQRDERGALYDLAPRNYGRLRLVRRWICFGTGIEIRRYVIRYAQLPVRGEDSQVGAAEASRLRKLGNDTRGNLGIVAC